MIRAGDGAICNPVTVNVLVPRESTEFLELFGVEDLTTVDWLLGIDERLRHPVVHTEIEVQENEDRGLQLLRKVEGLNSELKALLDRSRKQKDVFRIPMGESCDRPDIALRGASG